MSPDPIIQDPLNTQSYNRYTYVFNNPLRYVDPTGFTCEDSGNPDTGGSCTTTAPDLSGGNGGFTVFDFLQFTFNNFGELYNNPDYNINDTYLGGTEAGAFAESVHSAFDPVNNLNDLKEELAIAGVIAGITGMIAKKADKFKKWGEKIKETFARGNKEKKVGARDKSADKAVSSSNGLKLQKQLASEEQLSQLSKGGGNVITQPAKQANRISKETGQNAQDIQKVSSRNKEFSNGSKIQTHAFRNAKTNELIEPKTIIDFTK